MAVFRGFLHFYCPMAPGLSGLRDCACRPDKTVRRHPATTTTTYALPLQQHRLNMADSARRVQSLRTYTDAVHNAVTAEYAECIAHPFQTTVGLVSRLSIRNRYAASSPAGPINLSGFHQNDGQDVGANRRKEYIHTAHRVFHAALASADAHEPVDFAHYSISKA
ncbi:Uncharacterised protein [Salmonella enterica subsp. enterica]|nr:Uncharacterised protein [Salmonella enterica subsp. enterica] [Salmonella enterica subsp. enterica serovar Menston]